MGFWDFRIAVTDGHVKLEGQNARGSRCPSASPSCDDSRQDRMLQVLVRGELRNRKPPGATSMFPASTLVRLSHWRGPSPGRRRESGLGAFSRSVPFKLDQFVFPGKPTPPHPSPLPQFPNKGHPTCSSVHDPESLAGIGPVDQFPRA